jgi:broad specificity phosphatase PhoE
MKLLFIRHGQTEVNASGSMHIMNDDAGLSVVGVQQAEKLVNVCRENSVQLLYSSGENRAKQTAEIISKGLGVANTVLTGLHERNWGKWEGRTWSEIKSELDEMSIEERYTFVPPGGESWQQMELRLKNCLEHIIAEGEVKGVSAIAVVTHGGALRGLMPILKNKPKEVGLKYDFENASVTVFDYMNGNFVEVLVNDISHLTS